ncbi:NUDIX domain-containing protein [Algiphilus sp.]|uniref:NUDIX domain-containing protein n=1 Tax=Algiphilus sp. TaxID=1872431 RepID=UPI003C45DDC9
MSADSGFLGAADFRHAVASVPLVSIDLLVVREGHLLLGRRRDEPARDTWFVPGGRIRRGESIGGALTRIWAAELDGDMEARPATLVGAYEHHYECCFDGSPIATHYVVLAHRITPRGVVRLKSESHLAEWWAPVMSAPAEHDGVKVHPNTLAYFGALAACGGSRRC